MQAQETILNDRYRLLQQAGSGGMATVFKAHDLTLRRLVAVKVLHERLTGDVEAGGTRVGHAALEAEQKTEVFERRGTGRVQRPERSTGRERAPRRRRRRPAEAQPEAVHVPAPAPEAVSTDWTAVALSLIALVAMLGLIPLWYFVARAWGV